MTSYSFPVLLGIIALSMAAYAESFSVEDGLRFVLSLVGSLTFGVINGGEYLVYIIFSLFLIFAILLTLGGLGFIALSFVIRILK